VIASLDAFRREARPAGAGDFPLFAESALPLVHDPNSETGRSALNIPPLNDVRFVPFRLRPGDDASCLNLYQPSNPRILAPPNSFSTANQWRLLETELEGGAIPAIADANSMTYVLHVKPGEDFERAGVRYRIVAVLEDSIFQSELLISERNFLRLFPEVEGYRFFLLSALPAKMDQVTAALEDALSGYGFDVQATAARLAGYHKVENTYLATFRSLGGLGLLLGTVGLAAVLMRNALERRKELALLRAVGFSPRKLSAIILAENLALLLLGIATGCACAALAVAPAILARGGHIPAGSLSVLLFLVLAMGAAASLAASAAVLRSPLLESLSSE
jgi:ABC-type antimicrobial peptide transport system permease subunit